MSISKRTVETLLDPVEVKLSYCRSATAKTSVNSISSKIASANRTV